MEFELFKPLYGVSVSDTTETVLVYALVACIVVGVVASVSGALITSWWDYRERREWLR